MVWRLHTASSVSEIKSWVLDEKLSQKIRRSMLFALSLIEAPQAARAMVEVAQKGNNETSNLAKAFIDKRDQGIWNNYNVKDLLAEKNLPKPRMLIVFAPTAFGPETKLPKISEILELKETQRMGKVLSGDVMFVIK